MFSRNYSGQFYSIKTKFLDIYKINVVKFTELIKIETI